ncbi:MAG: zinc ribbon domain-containing protein [Candidatus Kapaibacterium sp.]
MTSRSIFRLYDSHDGEAHGGMMRCTGCGTVGYQGDRYCPCCGLPLVRNCRQCGAAIAHPIANFCTACGLPLDGERPPKGDA